MTRSHDLVAVGSLSEETAEFLAMCVRAHLNIIVSGGTGTGKTTLLRALAMLIDVPADLVVTDVEMPTLGGRGMVDELHELSPGLRVLFMSGYTDNEILRRGIRTSETDFLQKPFTAESLCAAVRAVLSKPSTTTA